MGRTAPPNFSGSTPRAILEEEILAVPNNTENLKTRQTGLTHTVLVKSIFGCFVEAYALRLRHSLRRRANIIDNV